MGCHGWTPRSKLAQRGMQETGRQGDRASPQDKKRTKKHVTLEAQKRAVRVEANAVLLELQVVRWLRGKG